MHIFATNCATRILFVVSREIDASHVNECFEKRSDMSGSSGAVERFQSLIMNPVLEVHREGTNIIVAKIWNLSANLHSSAYPTSLRYSSTQTVM